MFSLFVCYLMITNFLWLNALLLRQHLINYVQHNCHLMLSRRKNIKIQTAYKNRIITGILYRRKTVTERKKQKQSKYIIVNNYITKKKNKRKRKQKKGEK